MCASYTESLSLNPLHGIWLTDTVRADWLQIWLAAIFPHQANGPSVSFFLSFFLSFSLFLYLNPFATLYEFYCLPAKYRLQPKKDAFELPTSRHASQLHCVVYDFAILTLLLFHDKKYIFYIFIKNHKKIFSFVSLCSSLACLDFSKAGSSRLSVQAFASPCLCGESWRDLPKKSLKGLREEGGTHEAK